jgi:hypothetical protein
LHRAGAKIILLFISANLNNIRKTKLVRLRGVAGVPDMQPKSKAFRNAELCMNHFDDFRNKRKGATEHKNRVQCEEEREERLVVISYY